MKNYKIITDKFSDFPKGTVLRGDRKFTWRCRNVEESFKTNRMLGYKDYEETDDEETDAITLMGLIAKATNEYQQGLRDCEEHSRGEARRVNGGSSKFLSERSRYNYNRHNPNQ